MDAKTPVRQIKKLWKHIPTMEGAGLMRRRKGARR